jgi:hypothetical protein
MSAGSLRNRRRAVSGQKVANAKTVAVAAVPRSKAKDKDKDKDSKASKAANRASLKARVSKRPSRRARVVGGVAMSGSSIARLVMSNPSEARASNVPLPWIVKIG